MPIYEYQCDSCGHVFEHYTFGGDHAATQACPRCGKGEAKKIISSFSSYCGKEGGCDTARTGFS